MLLDSTEKICQDIFLLLYARGHKLRIPVQEVEPGIIIYPELWIRVSDPGLAEVRMGISTAADLFNLHRQFSLHPLINPHRRLPKREKRSC